MTYTFQKLAKKGRIEGIDIRKGDADEAKAWFREKAFNIKSMSVKKFQGDATPFQNLESLSPNSIGKMYTFSYDPKWKNELPYYDIFPLIFPIEFYGDSMLGINLHYLSPFFRAKLMDALYTTINNDKYNKTTQLRINYGILKGAAQFKYFKPCLKKYLFSHVRSPFMNINPEAWDYTLMLPLARFQKKSADYVWFESALNVN